MTGAAGAIGATGATGPTAALGPTDDFARYPGVYTEPITVTTTGSGASASVLFSSVPGVTVFYNSPTDAGFVFPAGTFYSGYPPQTGNKYFSLLYSEGDDDFELLVMPSTYTQYNPDGGGQIGVNGDFLTGSKSCIFIMTVGYA